MSVVIETGFVGIDYALDHPRTGWQMPDGATATGSTEATGFAASSALDPRTLTAWQPTAFPATWRVTFPGNNVVSYIGVGAHDLGSKGCQIVAQEFTGGSWVDIAGTTHTPTDDSAILFLLSARSTSTVRVHITDPGSASLPTIAHIRAGAVMEWPQRADFTGMPITDARQIEYKFNGSQTGEWLGQTIKRRGLSFEASIRHLSETWTASTYEPFREYADTGAPFFYAARPSKYAGEVAYCMADGLIQSQRGLPNARVSRDVTMKLRGYARNG